MFHWGLLGGSVALSLITAAGAAPTGNANEFTPASEVEIADISGVELLSTTVAARPLTIGQIGDLREDAVTFARVMDLLQQASVSSDGRQFGSQVSITALQLALILEHYSSDVINQPTYQELHRAHAIGRQFIPDAATELPVPLVDLTITPDGVPAVDSVVIVSAPADDSGTEPALTTDLLNATTGTSDGVIGLTSEGFAAAPAGGEVADGQQMLEGEVAEVLTEVTVNGRVVILDSTNWDDVAFVAVYLASLMSPDNLNAAAVSITLPELESVELAGEELEFASPAELIANLISKYSQTTEGYANGYLPAEVLCEIPWTMGQQSRCDAAGGLIALNEAFKAEFGYDLPIGSSYRPFETQIQLALTKPHLAATPGTSMHGWGLAIDFGAPIFGGASPEYYWMLQNAPTYGWDNPAWARLDGRKPEPWHFEFMAAKPTWPGPGQIVSVAFPERNADGTLQWPALNDQAAPSSSEVKPGPTAPTVPVTPGPAPTKAAVPAPPSAPAPEPTHPVEPAQPGEPAQSAEPSAPATEPVLPSDPSESAQHAPEESEPGGITADAAPTDTTPVDNASLPGNTDLVSETATEL